MTKIENEWIQAQKSLTAKMGKMSLDGDIFPPRPQFGDKGRQVILHANYFNLTVKPMPIY